MAVIIEDSMEDVFMPVRKEVLGLKDKLGRAIDPGILELVVALRFHGVHTISSCEGHADRTTSGPYVMFEAPETHDFRRRYREAKDKKSTEYRHWHNKAVQANVPEVRRVLGLLADFYEHRLSPNDQHIIVRSFDASVGELICQGAEIARILPAAERELLLQKNRAEMQAFTDYLKLRPLTPSADGREGVLQRSD